MNESIDRPEAREKRAKNIQDSRPLLRASAHWVVFIANDRQINAHQHFLRAREYSSASDQRAHFRSLTATFRSLTASGVHVLAR